ncbi:MAG: hypothetical protein GY849_07670, partial [Deltaproteobacteria bacterium]|nr:hypothetical protein [Deltaproteobacteria bacterium]
IPSSDPIPVSWGWFQALLLLTFVLHLLFMNTMLGTGIIALVSHLKRPKSSLPVTADISKRLPYTIAFTVNLGVPPLLFLQVLYGHFFYVSSVLMAVYWISIIALLILAYYSAYIYDFKYETLGAARVIFIGTTVLILLFIGFLFTNNLTLMLHPEGWKAYFQRPGGTLLNLSDPTLIPRYLHFVTASLAVGGLSLALFGRFKRSGGMERQRERIHLGLNWFCYATIVQMFIGLWFLMTLPSSTMGLFMGTSPLHSIVLLAGVAGAVLSLIFGFKKRVIPTAVSLVGTVVGMALMRELVRKAYLGPYFSLSSLKVIPQYSPLIMFLCSFAVGLSVVGFILWLAAKGRKEI